MAVKAFQALGVLAAVALAWMLVDRPAPLESCGTFFEYPEFVRTHRLSLDAIERGEWDIIQPSFGHFDLWLAYRHMTGRGLSRAERQVVAPAGRMLAPEEAAYPGPVWVKRWLDARKQVPGARSIERIGVHRELERFQYYENCLEDAFRTAERTLGQRIGRFGAASVAVREWLAAQDQVFENCSGRGRAIPGPAVDALPALVRADRAYQIAAAHFYSGDFDIAERRFREIASDAFSPWRTMAPYLAARAMIRRATLAGDSLDRAGLQQAASALREILADKARLAMHEPAMRLLGFVRLRIEPEQRFAELAEAVLRTDSPESLGQDWIDYHYLLDHRSSEGRDDFTEWLVAFSQPGRSGLDRALERRHSLPWLVAALTKVAPGDATLPELLRAAEQVKAGSPAHPTVAFHTVRLLAASGEKDAARRRLDALIAARKGYGESARNLFRAQRMTLARNLDEFLRDAPRTPVGNFYMYGEPVLPPPRPPRLLFDADAAHVLNERLPLRLLRESTSSTRLPQALRREVVLAAWVRAVLLEDTAVARPLASAAAREAPEVKPDLDSWLAAATPESRRFAAAVLLLRWPGLRPYVAPGFGRDTPRGRIDNLRDNWWCSFGESDDRHGIYDHYRRLAAEPGPLGPGRNWTDFLNAEDREQARREWEKLTAVPTAPNWLAAQVLAWARRNPEDLLVPEALHLTVRATRYGCTDENTGEFSREAFTLLHRRYPRSEWAKRTPFWYR